LGQTPKLSGAPRVRVRVRVRVGVRARVRVRIRVRRSYELLRSNPCLGMPIITAD